MAIISFINQPAVIQKILKHLGLWEESHAPLGTDPAVKEITFLHYHFKFYPLMPSSFAAFPPNIFSLSPAEIETSRTVSTDLFNGIGTGGKSLPKRT